MNNEEMNGFMNGVIDGKKFDIIVQYQYKDHHQKIPYIEAIIHDPNNELTHRDLKDLYKGLSVVSIDNGIPVITSYISATGESDHPKDDEFDGDTISVVGTSLDVLQSNAPRKLIDITSMSSRKKLVLFKYIIDKITLFDPNDRDEVAIKIKGFDKDNNFVNVMFTKVTIRGCNYALPTFNFQGMDVIYGMISNHDCAIFSGIFDDKVKLMSIKFDTPTCDINWVFGSHKQTVEIFEKSEIDI